MEHARVIIETLARAMYARDAATFRHSERVRRYTMAYVRHLAPGGADLLHALDAGALLHDVGKLGIPDRLLHKPAPLTPAEYDVVKQHSVIGGEMLASLPFPGPLAAIVRHHHEHWDGSGYPDALAGTDIPLGARILAVTDCYDALTTDRPYRDALAHETAIAMIRKESGSIFDPAIAGPFIGFIESLRSAVTATGCAEGAEGARPQRSVIETRGV